MGAALSYCKSILTRQVYMKTHTAMPSPVPPAGLTLRSTLRTQGEIRRSVWSPDGRWLAVPSADRVLRLWDGEKPGTVRILEEGRAAWGVAWSPDGRTLAAGIGLKEAVVWDVERLKPLMRLSHSRGVPAVLFAQDGRSLITGGDDHVVRIWDVATGEPRARLSGHSKGVTRLVWQPGGARLASSSLDHTVRLWDVAAEREDHILRGHHGGVLDLAWSPDGRLLAAASADSVVRLWHPGESERTRLEGHQEAVNGVAFSADGRLLASKSLDGTVRFWSTADWRLAAVLDEPATERNPSGTVAFHPHLPILATLGDGDTAVRLWDVDVEALLAPPAASSSPHESPAGHDVFLCYNTEDRPMVKAIGLALQDLGIRPWLDEDEVRPGTPWQDAVEREITKFQAAAVFVGARGVGPWQRAEVRALLNEFVTRKCPVIPVILPGCAASPELPLFLKEMTWTDFRKSDPHPLEYLVWGITGSKPRANEPMGRQIAQIVLSDLLARIRAAGGVP